MISLTKNHQTEAAIKEMVSKAFPGKEAAGITELTEGFFNAAYRIKLRDGQNVILKIAPPGKADIMTYEKNLMYAEVNSMRLVKERTSVPVPEILFYSPEHSGNLCESDYFFMTALTGENYNSVKSTLNEEEQYRIDYEIGRYNRRINRIEGSSFGYFASASEPSADWKTVFQSMAECVLRDGKVRNIDIGLGYTELNGRIKDKLYALEPVKTPKLVHWDLWDGNVFVKNGQVEGIIDFERSIWGDPLMEYAFRRHSRRRGNQGFMDGYGATEPDRSTKIRSMLYDIYLYLIMIIECDYRKYPDDSQYLWAKQMLADAAADLIKE